MSFTIIFFVEVFLTALLAGLGWALGLLIIARVFRERVVR